VSGRSADDVLWRRTKCGLGMTDAQRARVVAYVAACVAACVAKAVATAA
jgi:glycerol-3-phosphate dehydrogenase